MRRRLVYLMKKVGSCLVTAGFGVLVAATHAEATTLSFEDFSGAFVPAGYAGFQWGGGFGDLSWVNAVDGLGTDLGPNENAHTGTHYLVSNAGFLTISDGLFDFNSFWVANAFAAQTVTVRGFLAGNQTYLRTFNVLVDTYSFVTANFLGVDTIKFDPWSSGNLYFDDITVNNSSVPEPASVLLLGSSAAALLARRRRYKGNA